MTQYSYQPIVAGWKEHVSFPEWGIKNLIVKLDTGALGSALDVKNIKELSNDHVSFEVVLLKENRNFTQKIIAKIVTKTRIKSSTGHVQERYKVKTKVKIGPVCRTILVSLHCRKSMNCRMLLGRTALEHVFLVDSSKTYLLEERKKTKRIKLNRKSKKK